MDTEIVLTGQRTEKVVEGWGNSHFVQTDLGFRDRKLGILVSIFEPENPDPVQTIFWEVPSEYKIPSCFRAMRFIDSLPAFGRTDIARCYEAALWRPSIHYLHYQTSIMLQVGEEEYWSMMLMQIPSKVVDLIISLLDRGEPIDKIDLTAEVKARTITWRSAFTAHGVMRPYPVGRQITEVSKIIRRYTRHHRSYLQYRRYKEDGHFSVILSENLVDVDERGIEATHGPDVAIGLAIVRSMEDLSAYVHHETSRAFDPPFTYDQERTRSDIFHVTAWLTGEFLGSRVVLKPKEWDPIGIAIWLYQVSQKGFISRNPKRTRIEYIELLQQILSGWYDMPITHPLIRRH